MTKKEQSTILIVDDDTMCLNFLIHLLYGECTILIAKDGQTAIETAVKNSPDLIILDIDMPGMTGIEVLSKLRTFEETKTTPVVFFTSNDRLESEAACFNLGAVDYIKKSSGADIIRMRIRNQLHIINNMRQPDYNRQYLI